MTMKWQALKRLIKSQKFRFYMAKLEASQTIPKPCI